VIGETLNPLSLNLVQLNDQVYSLLKEEIFRGNLPPGQRLSPGALAKRLGISVTPVRDALQRLSSDGLVEIQPRRGTFVTQFSEKSLREIYECRRIIECAAADKLVAAPATTLDELDGLVAEMRARADQANFANYSTPAALDARFHELIVGLLDNDRLIEFYRALRWTMQISRGLVAMSADYARAQRTAEQHASIAHAFRRQDVAGAKAALIDHLESAQDDLLQRLRHREEAAPPR